MAFSPNVPKKVPGNVPTPSAAGASPRPPRARGKHFTGSPAGWRFQYRLPKALTQADSTHSRTQAIIRKWLGPLPIREAEARARQLAVLCRTVAATAPSMETSMGDQVKQDSLLSRTIAACQAAIGAALHNPAEAMSIAQGLDAALATLKLVAGEAAKGPAGNPAITGNAAALTEGALASVLYYK